MNFSLEVYPVCFVENRLECQQKWKQVTGYLATAETQTKGDGATRVGAVKVARCGLSLDVSCRTVQDVCLLTCWIWGRREAEDS